MRLERTDHWVTTAPITSGKSEEFYASTFDVGTLFRLYISQRNKIVWLDSGSDAARRGRGLAMHEVDRRPK